jgi:hypothetical protein
MTDALTIGWTAAQAQTQRRTFQRILALNMLLQVVIGLACMFAPDFASRALGLPPPVPSGWVRGWGATLIFLTALYIPPLQDPVRSRFANIAGILGRLWMATVWLALGGGLIWLGLFDLLFAVVLAGLYYRLFEAELQSRP